MFGKPFEMPSNLDLEQAIEKNMSHINPVEIKKYTGSDGNKRLFPFWSPVKDAEGVTFTDYKKYLSNRDKALDIKKKSDDDKTGVVQVKDTEKTYEDGSLLDKIQKLINKQSKNLSDKSGIVNPPKNELKETKTDKKVTENKIGELKVEIDKSASSKTGVGAVVQPKSESLPSKNIKPEIKNIAIKQEVKTEKISAPKKAGEMGIVKAKSDMQKQNIPDITKNSEKAKGGEVGAVKAKSAISVNPQPINFDKYKTDHITKPVKK